MRNIKPIIISYISGKQRHYVILVVAGLLTVCLNLTVQPVSRDELVSQPMRSDGKWTERKRKIVFRYEIHADKEKQSQTNHAQPLRHMGFLMLVQPLIVPVLWANEDDRPRLQAGGFDFGGVDREHVYAAIVPNVFQVPGVPDAVQIQPDSYPAFGIVASTTSPRTQSPAVGAAVPMQILFLYAP